MALNEKERKMVESSNLSQGEKVLEVKNLTISFRTDNGKVQAVRGVSFDLHKGETLCIVGESGSGKSVTSKAIMGILSKNAIVEGGEIIYQGEDLLKVSEDEFHRIRGHKIGMIFQDPLSSLNPIVKIGKQIIETMMINSNQLKNLYDDLIAEKLTAYKNAKVVRNSKISHEKIQLDLLVNEHKKQEEKINKEIGDIKYTISLIKKGKAEGDIASLEEDIAARKASLAELKAKAKASEAEAKAKVKATSKEAKQEYDEVAPGLKEDLSLKKKEAKVEVNNYKNELKRKRDDEIDRLKFEMESISISEADEAAIKEIDGKIRRVKARRFWTSVLFFFSAKKKLPIQEECDKQIAELQEERHQHRAELDDCISGIDKAKLEYKNAVKITKKEAKKRALEVMREVGIPQPEKRFYQYPFQFSGGMRQRIVIAIALTAAPDILICDEPTTALDVTIQAQILELINKLKEQRHLSCIFITHDLGVVANMADRVAVMYAGKICEYGTDKEIFFDPRHPYTWALLSSIPDIDSKEKLEAIPGTPPDMIYPPEGDAFALRNKYALAIDFKYQPPLFKVTDTHYAATWLLHPSAPKVEMPKIVSTRIHGALKEEEEAENGK